MSASQKREQKRFQKRGETFFYNPWQVTVVTNPASALFQDRALDPPDLAMVESFVLTRKQLHNIATRTNGTRVLEEGDPWLTYQVYDRDYDPANPLVAGAVVPNHEVIYGRGRTSAMREAVVRLVAEGQIQTSADMLFIESKAYGNLTDAECLQLIAMENEIRRATTIAGQIDLAIRTLKANNGDYAAVAMANGVSSSTIKNWEKLWGCHPCVLAAACNEEIGQVLAWTYFPLVPREKHEELMRLFRASGARKGADAETTMVRLVDQVLGRKPAPAPDAAPASHTRTSDPPVGGAVRAPAPPPPPPHQARPAPSSDLPKRSAGGGTTPPAPPAAPLDNVSNLPKARDVHALRRSATGCREASKAAKAVNPIEARDLKIAALVLAHASGKDDALNAFPHIIAAMNGTYTANPVSSEEPTGS